MKKKVLIVLISILIILLTGTLIFYNSKHFIILNGKEKIELNDKELKLFLNGVKLTNNNIDGIYRIYNQNNFIGLGIIENNKFKRDIIL